MWHRWLRERSEPLIEGDRHPARLAVTLAREQTLLGSFAELNREPAEGGGIGPVLRIVGTAVLGNVEIRTLPRGASAHGERALPSSPKAPALPHMREDEP